MAGFGPGTLMVSVPAMFDVHFFRTVVLLFQNSDDGTAGVIVNRPTGSKISELGGEFANQTCGIDQPVYSGGPVEGPLLAIHESLVWGEVGIMPGVFLSSNKNNLVELARQDKHRCRFIANYSGWGKGQLQDEIDAGGWLHLMGTPELIFADDETIWRNICERLGTDVMLGPKFRTDSNHSPELN